MAPEALHDPPQYNEKLDVFSFGNIILSTLTHEWPNPGPPNHFQGDQLVASNELQRRDHYIAMFTVQEKQLFLPTANQCLENRPDKRPSSVILVRELRRIESSLPTGSHVTTLAEQLHQQLLAKEEECRQKDEVIRVKEVVIRVKDKALRESSDALSVRDEALRETSAALIKKYEALREASTALREKNKALRVMDAAVREKDTTICIGALLADIQVQQTNIRQLRDQPAVTPKVS